MVTLWDEAFQTAIKSYRLEQSMVTGDCCLRSDLPTVRSLSLGQDCILVGTKNSEVCVCVGVGVWMGVCVCVWVVCGWVCMCVW